MLNYDVFEAFKSAGADAEKARRAAEALAHSDGQMDERFGKLDARFERVDDRFVAVDARFMRIEAKLDLHSWILGFNTAMLAALMWRVFSG